MAEVDRNSSAETPRPPLLSIVTATYNSLAFIDRLYLSLCAQDPDLFEWIVVDDRSTDDTFERVRALVAAAPFRARAWRLPANSGGGVALAFGFQAAQGELACHIDHDDELLPGAVSGLAATWAEAERKGGFAGLFMRSLDGASAKLNGWRMRRGGGVTASSLTNLHRNPCDGAYVLRRDLFVANYTPDYAQLCALNGMVWLKITRRNPIYNSGNQVFFRYHRDNPLSQMNAPKVSEHTVFSYAELMNNGDWLYLLRPLLHTRRLLNLLRFSEDVYGSAREGMSLLKSPVVRLYATLVGPLRHVLRHTVWRPVIVVRREPYPLDRLSEIEAA
jgi:glycosyltransferase involved in cell wall biosynthesis